jgi:hypothetical protein
MESASKYAATSPRDIPEWEQEVVRNDLRLFSELQTYRNVHAGVWEESAALVDPKSRNTFFYGSYNWPGTKKTEQQIDSTGALAVQQFCAIADSLVTPKNQKYQGFQSDPYLMKQRDVAQYFDDLRDIVLDYRERDIGNFRGQNFQNWKSLACFGNGTMYTDAFDSRWHYGSLGLRYKSIPLGETFYAENHQGLVTTLVRWFRRTASQAVEQWGIDALPSTLRPALEMNAQTPFNFLHCVYPRSMKEYDPDRLDARGKPFVSHYISIEGKCLMEPPSGYRVFPYAVSRYGQSPGEVYADGPTQLVLPTLKTLNAEKRIFLKTGHRAADPVLLTNDDGLMSWNQKPGAINPGGVSADGKVLVHGMPVGNIQITKEMMETDAAIVDTMFLTSLFKTLTEHPEMTATQTLELLNERGMLVSPVLGRQFSEYIGGLSYREVDLLTDMRQWRGGKMMPVLPPMPAALKEARGEYRILDTTPLAMSARMSELAGFNRWVDQLHQWVGISGDQSILDPIDFETAVPEGSQISGVPVRWTATPQKIQAKQQNRAAMQKQQAAIAAMPAQAAMMKAQAASLAAGAPPPGQQPQGAPPA